MACHGMGMVLHDMVGVWHGRGMVWHGMVDVWNGMAW